MSQVRPTMMATSVSLEKIELKRLRERVERLVSALEEAMEVDASDSYDSFLPAVDLCETRQAVHILVELPGITRDDIELTVTAKDLVLEGEKKFSPGKQQKAISHFCCERQYGKFQRRIQLRWAININEATAELIDGVLKIKLPKLIDRRGKSVKITIKAEE